MQTVHVNVIDAFAVDPETIDGRVLRYPRLAERITTLEPLIVQAKHHLQHAAPDAFTNHRLNREITSFELLRTAQALQLASSLSEERVLAAEFTKLSKQLFGQPDFATASHLATEALLEFRAWRGKVDEASLHTVEEAYEQLIHDHTKIEPVSVEANAVSTALKDELQARYHELFALIDNGPERYAAADAANVFEQALRLLAASDPGWSEWIINRKPDAAICSVSAVNKQINIGLRRQVMTRTECKGVFAHEVLVHARRAVNGGKLDFLLATGLPGYVAAEEGLAVLLEFAITDKMPYKMFDRYIDAALALKGMNRQQLFTVALARAKLRMTTGEVQIKEEDLRLIVWAQTNRIYRGTKGDEAVGVFTKDIGYYQGFAMTVSYMVRALADGTPLPDVLDFLLSAKFDPSNKRHLTYLASHNLPIAP